jgi:hypothetical protein
MTATELQDKVVRMLANWGWCRYWLHWNYPRQEPWLMAVQVLELRPDRNPPPYWPAPVPQLETMGFTPYTTYRPGTPAAETPRPRDVEPTWIYTIERTNDDGTPFRSNL